MTTLIEKLTNEDIIRLKLLIGFKILEATSIDFSTLGDKGK